MLTGYVNTLSSRNYLLPPFSIQKFVQCFPQKSSCFSNFTCCVDLCICMLFTLLVSSDAGSLICSLNRIYIADLCSNIEINAISFGTMQVKIGLFKNTFSKLARINLIKTRLFKFVFGPCFHIHTSFSAHTCLAFSTYMDVIFSSLLLSCLPTHSGH